MISVRLRYLRMDTPAVARAVDRARRRALSHAGGLVRKIARRSMRRTTRVSQYGKPPSAHGGQLRDLLVYAWDAPARTVVVGPLPFASRAAPLLEAGGVRRAPRRRRGRGARKPGAGMMRYHARPYMGPALAKAMPMVPELWAKSVRR